MLLGRRHAGWTRSGRACGIEDTRKGCRTANLINMTRCLVNKKGRTLHICVGLFEVIPSLGRLVVGPVVDGRDGHAVVLCVDNTRDPVCVLSEKSRDDRIGSHRLGHTYVTS